MANGDVYDGLAKAAGGDIGPTAELVGCVFTLLSFETVETKFKDDKGKNKVTQIATLVLEGQEESQRNWLGGVELNRQLPWLEQNGHLPVVVKLGGEGNQDSPYELVAPDQKAPAKKKAAPLKERLTSDDPLSSFRLDTGKLDTTAFVRWWQEQGLGPDELADVVGAANATAVEAWFAADPLRTTQTLIDEARFDSVPEDQELPFDDQELPFE